MTSVSTNVTGIVSSHFPFDDDFCAFGPKEDMITDLCDSFYFSYASLFGHYCQLRSYFLVFQIRRIYERSLFNRYFYLVVFYFNMQF